MTDSSSRNRQQVAPDHNTGFMRAVGDAQESFRPGAAGAQLIPEMSQLATNAYIADNQKLSGLAGNDLPRWLTSRESPPCSSRAWPRT